MNNASNRNRSNQFSIKKRENVSRGNRKVIRFLRLSPSVEDLLSGDLSQTRARDDDETLTEPHRVQLTQVTCSSYREMRLSDDLITDWP